MLPASPMMSALKDLVLESLDCDPALVARLEITVNIEIHTEEYDDTEYLTQEHVWKDPIRKDA